MQQASDNGMEEPLIGGSASVELSANRTALSLDRTRMSADRTLMSIVRTSLSLISFGFTIYKVFNKAAGEGILADGDLTARRFGFSLLVLGLALLVMGIWGHFRLGHQLTARRNRLHGEQLLKSSIRYQATPTLVVATALLVIGLFVVASIGVRAVLG
jgi:putative membrane protein